MNLDDLYGTLDLVADEGAPAGLAPSPSTGELNRIAAGIVRDAQQRVDLSRPLGAQSAFTEALRKSVERRGERVSAQHQATPSQTELFLDAVAEAAQRQLALDSFRKGICPRCESELPWSETCPFCNPHLVHRAGTQLGPRIQSEPRHIFVADQGGVVRKHFVEGREDFDDA